MIPLFYQSRSLEICAVMKIFLLLLKQAVYFDKKIIKRIPRNKYQRNSTIKIKPISPVFYIRKFSVAWISNIPIETRKRTLYHRNIEIHPRAFHHAVHYLIIVLM